MRQTIANAIAVSVVAGLAGGVASAGDVRVTIENTGASGGFSLTPVWVGFHNGGFDSYDGGALAAGFPGLEEIAEGGDTMPISNAFAASAAGVAGGFDTTLASSNAAPVFSPGEVQSFNLSVGDASVNRYFSYASMVVPTNDLFIANGNPMAHELFDAAGNFNGPVEILIFGRDVNDAGTEVNDAFGGAAFSTNGGVGVTEAVVVRNLFTDPGDAGYLASFIGTGTADGGTVTSAFGADDLIARITIVPAPATAGLGVMALGLAARRRRG